LPAALSKALTRSDKEPRPAPFGSETVVTSAALAGWAVADGTVAGKTDDPESWLLPDDESWASSEEESWPLPPWSPDWSGAAHATPVPAVTAANMTTARSLGAHRIGPPNS
jgi:hypothetical protein